MKALTRLPFRLLLALTACSIASLSTSVQAQLSEEEKQNRIKLIEKRVNEQTYDFLDKMGDMEKETVQTIGPQLQRFFYQLQIINAKRQAARKAAGDNPQKRRAAMRTIMGDLTDLYTGLRKGAKDALSKKELKQFNKVLNEVAPEPGQGGRGGRGGGGRGGR